MYYLHTITLFTRPAFPEINQVVRKGNVLTLSQRATIGTLLSHMFNPRLAERWEGFEILPSEDGIMVALRNPMTNQEYRYTGTRWEPASGITFHSPEQIRRGLPDWEGPIQFRFRLQRDRINQPAPELAEIKIGCHIPRNIIPDLVQWALPAMLRDAPIEFSRLLHLKPNTSVIPKQQGLNFERMTNPRLLIVPGQKRQVVTIASSDRLTIPTTTTQTTAHLIFGYKPRIEAVEHDDTFQVTEIPTVIVTLVGTDREMMVQARDWSRLPSNSSIVHCIPRVIDLLIEITVIAHSDSEAWAIANQLQSFINSRGFLEVPQYGIVVPMRVRRGIQVGLGEFSGEFSKGGLEAVSFRVLLSGVPEGQWTKQEQLVVALDLLSPAPLPNT